MIKSMSSNNPVKYRTQNRRTNLYLIDDEIPTAIPIDDNDNQHNDISIPKNITSYESPTRRRREDITTYTIKMIFIGDTNTGKTTTLYGLQQSNFHVEHPASTIGVEFGSLTRNVDNIRFKYNIWDTAGQEKFRSITTSFYKNSGVAILFFDITNYKTFISIIRWLQDVKNHCDPNIIILLVGNKADKKLYRNVPEKEVAEIIKKYNLEYLEISAKTGESIETVINRPTEIIMNKIHQRIPLVDIPGIRINEFIKVKTGKAGNLCSRCTIC